MNFLFKKSIRAFGFNDIWLLIVGIPISSLIMPIAFFGENPFQDFRQYCSKILVTFIFVTIHWMIDRQIVIYCKLRFPSLKDYAKRLVIQFLLVLIFTASFTYVCDYFLCNFITVTSGIAPPNILQLLSSSLMMTFTVLVTYEAIFLFLLWKQSLIETEELKKENYAAQLETLKGQVNPHFLFNSLNTLVSTIHDSPDLAVKFTQNLSKVYRYVIDSQNKKMIMLHEELEAIKHYIFLLETRFENKLSFEISLTEEDKQKFIIPLSTQMLIENAIKHNVVSSQNPLKVIIKSEGNYLIVKNNKQLKNQVQNSTKKGLKNIEKRYKLTCQEEIIINDSKDAFEVRIPLITIKNN